MKLVSGDVGIVIVGVWELHMPKYLAVSMSLREMTLNGNIKT